MPRNRLQRGAASAGDAGDPADAGRAAAGPPTARASFTDWLAADGAPWRPFDDRGVLVEARPRGARGRRVALELFDPASERQLVRHLKASCLWPARDRDKTWRLGDYSSYALDFEAPGGDPLSLRFWSEPQERTGGSPVSIAVWTPDDDDGDPLPLDRARQERLRDHGFEVSRRGRAQGRFAKEVLLPGARAVRALARETIAIVSKALDYDGAGALEFHLHLGTRLSAAFTFDGICAHDLAKLMQRWGFAGTEVDERSGQAPIIKSAVEEQPFLVAFVGERNARDGAYGMIGLRTFLRFEDGVPDGMTNAINTNFATVKASVDEDGDLVVQAPIILHGGVTPRNLEMWFKVWRETLTEIGAGLE
jgi:hypothetical protein